MRTLIFLIGIVVLASCGVSKTLNVVKLKKGSRLAQHEIGVNSTGDTFYKIRIYELGEKANVIINVKPEEVEVELLDKSELTPVDSIPHKDYAPIPDIKLNYLGNDPPSKYKIPYLFEYKNILEDSIDNKELLYSYRDTIGTEYFIGNNFRYYSLKYVFQALTIPFKIRPGIDGKPYEVATGVNAGIAFGPKWTFNGLSPIYSTEKEKQIGYYKSKVSLSFLPFLGLTTLKLSENNTDPEIANERTILGLNLGVSGVVEIDKLSIGFAYGFDAGFGGDASKWRHQGKNWIGLIIGLELIK